MRVVSTDCHSLDRFWRVWGKQLLIKRTFFSGFDLKRSGSYVEEGWRQLIVITLRQILQSVRSHEVKLENLPSPSHRMNYYQRRSSGEKTRILRNWKRLGPDRLREIPCDVIWINKELKSLLISNEVGHMSKRGGVNWLSSLLDRFCRVWGKQLLMNEVVTRIKWCQKK